MLSSPCYHAPNTPLSTVASQGRSSTKTQTCHSSRRNPQRLTLRTCPCCYLIGQPPDFHLSPGLHVRSYQSGHHTSKASHPREGRMTYRPGELYSMYQMDLMLASQMQVLRILSLMNFYPSRRTSEHTGTFKI